MKLIFVKEEFYLLSNEDFNEGDYYCVFSIGIKGIGRGWGKPRIHVNSNVDKINKCTLTNYKGKLVASSVKIGDLPLIDYKQIIHGENFLPFVKNLSTDVEKLALEKYPILIDETDITIEDEDKAYRNNWAKGYKQSLYDNYENKFTQKDIEEALTYGYHAAKDEAKGIPSSGYMTRFLESKNKEKNEWNCVIEMQYNCGVIGINNPPIGSKIIGGEACFQQWQEPKINEKGYINIIQITI